MKMLFNKCTGFDWNDRNSLKNWLNHKVTIGECEQFFFNEPLIVFDDTKHSQEEQLMFLL